MRRPTSPEEIIAFFLEAYRQGAFPMAELPRTSPADGRIPTARAIHWYSPEPRAILPIEEGSLRVPTSVSRTLRKQRFALTSDRCFERVIRACAEPTPRRGGAWLDESLVRCYTLLHQAGHAHSIEAWNPAGNLVGGIYGVSIGGAFFAESMFSDIEAGGSGASSACLIALWSHLRSCAYELLDVQIANPHTLRFGVREIPSLDYMLKLDSAGALPDRWRPLPAPNQS
jgi:leucyl/phenylalanyl-tRNA---protein transferase